MPEGISWVIPLVRVKRSINIFFAITVVLTLAGYFVLLIGRKEGVGLIEWAARLKP